MSKGRTESGTRRAVSAPDWLHAGVPMNREVLETRVRQGIAFVAERRGHQGLSIGMKLLADLPGFLNYALDRPGYVTAHAAALWNMWKPEPADEVVMDLLDTCYRLLAPGMAPDYWGDFLATVRGALAS